MTHKICFKATTKEISVLPLASEVPVGFTNIGNYIHDAEGDPLGSAVSHVLYHHIRDALYPLGVQDMAYIGITFTSEVGAPPIVCAYPLDATQTDIDANFGPGTGVTPLPIIDGGKGIEFTPQTGLGTTETKVQFNSPLSYSIDITAGKKALELLFDFTSSGLDTNKATAYTKTTFRLMDDNNYAASFSVKQRYGETILAVSTQGSGGAVVTEASVNSSPIRLGVLIDADTGVFSATLNGVPVSLVTGGDEFVPGMYTLTVVNQETGSSYSLGPIDSDKVVTMHLYTDQSDMTGTYPAGTTDICGNAL